jgi:hypothetical protein
MEAMWAEMKDQLQTEGRGMLWRALKRTAWLEVNGEEGIISPGPPHKALDRQGRMVGTWEGKISLQLLKKLVWEVSKNLVWILITGTVVSFVSGS